MKTGVTLCLIVTLFAAHVDAGHSEITLNCKYHKHSSYACIVLGFENHVVDITVSEVKGDHINGKSNSDVVELVIKDQNASFVPVNFQDYFPNLISFEVKNSSLTDISRQNFAGLKKIKTVVLENNDLKSLNSNVFNDLINLEHLRLSGNKLTKLHFKLLANNADLKVIMLDNNAIKFVHELLFENLSNLEEVYLQNNQIEDLRDRTLRKNKKLEVIDMSNNKLKSIGPKLLEGLNNLKLFDFTSNDCVGGYDTVGELVEEIKNSCFPPDFVRYEEEIKRLKKAEELANETLSTCRSDLENAISNKTDLETKVEEANETKAAIEEERDSCIQKNDDFDKEVEALNKKLEDIESELEGTTKNLTLCEASHGSTMATFRNIDTILDRTNITFDQCLYKVSVLKKALDRAQSYSLGTDEKADRNQVSTFHADKGQLITERDDLTQVLQVEKEENRKQRQENEELKRKLEELASGNQNVATTSDLGECKNLLQETKTKLQSRETDLKSCLMSQLPLCTSFYIDCLFTLKEVNREEEYTCKSKHVLACQPGMKLGSVDGIHLSGKHNNDVNVLEIQDSMYQFTNDVFKQLPFLRKFYIKNSGLSSLQPPLRSTSLRELDIEENKFSEVPARSFEGIAQLEELRLENNWIETVSLEAFVGLSSLNGLSLKDNQIRELPLGVFDYLPRLTHLSLKNNLLTSLHGDLFQQNTRLEVIQFDNNKDLMTIGINLLNFSRSWRILNFAGTCVGNSNEASLQEAKSLILRNCQNGL